MSEGPREAPACVTCLSHAQVHVYCTVLARMSLLIGIFTLTGPRPAPAPMRADVIRESSATLLGTQAAPPGLALGRPVDFGSGLPLSALGITDAGPEASTPPDGGLTYNQLYQVGAGRVT